MVARVTPATTTKARALRRNMTDVERLLWRALRDKQISNCRFRRQHPIGQFITDFACLERKVVIELDGGQHQEQIKYDEKRTTFLREQGWQVLRFWNNDVLQNFDGVFAKILDSLKISPPS